MILCPKCQSIITWFEPTKTIGSETYTYYPMRKHYDMNGQPHCTQSKLKIKRIAQHKMEIHHE